MSASAGPEVGAVGVTLLFLPGLPFVFMGLAISFTVGPSVLPVTFAVEVTDTEIAPLMTF
ncbi:MAG TPA: hypothetical protein VG204_22845 [Terriglobia bacterium]|nr:hypothetical protein [Terriglobia bacterium]